MCPKLKTAVLFCATVLFSHVYGQIETSPAPLIDEVFISDAKNHSWTSTNFPEPYPYETKTLTVKVDNGYTISVIVTDLDLDSENGDFLVIKAGTTLNDENTGKIFIHELKNPQKYVIDASNATMSFVVLGKNEAGKKGFSLLYKREGEEVTTVEPVTEVTWPTPADTDRIYFTANISGYTQEDYENATILNDFKTAVAQMATEYCTISNISVSENITQLNVHIKILMSCPYEWPKSSTCAKIIFSLPIFLHEDSNSTHYELSSENLAIMWNLYADKYLNQFSMSVYVKPSTNSKLLMWLLLSAAVIIVFIIILCIIRRSSFNISLKTLKRRNSDTKGIVKNEMRASNLSLSPHPLQVIPPFFDTAPSFNRFEPDIRFSSDDESDNEITIGRFNHNRNNTTTNNNKTESSS